MSRTFRLRHAKKHLDDMLWRKKDLKASHYPDGAYHDEGHHHYKEYTDQKRRLNEKKFLDQIGKKDYDELPLPSEKQTKYLAWVVW